MISAPREAVSAYLRDLGRMPEYERKVHRLEVASNGADGAAVSGSGEFLGLAWKSDFRVEFTRDGGYHAEIPLGTLFRLSVSYQLRQVAGGTVLTHEERYQAPFIVRPVLAGLRRWIYQALDWELHAIKEGAEQLHRMGQLREIEKL